VEMINKTKNQAL